MRVTPHCPTNNLPSPGGRNSCALSVNRRGFSDLVKMKILLIDTFNKVTISKHFTLRAALVAQRKHLALVKRVNGQNSYLTYGVKYSDGTPVDGDEITATIMQLDQTR